MKRIPDFLSMSRIALCLPLLLVDAMTVPFWTLYVIAGRVKTFDSSPDMRRKRAGILS